MATFLQCFSSCWRNELPATGPAPGANPEVLQGANGDVSREHALHFPPSNLSLIFKTIIATKNVTPRLKGHTRTLKDVPLPTCALGRLDFLACFKDSWDPYSSGYEWIQTFLSHIVSHKLLPRWDTATPRSSEKVFTLASTMSLLFLIDASLTNMSLWWT